MAQNLPEDMPVPKVPIDAQIIADAADSVGVERSRLVETLEDIHAYLATHAEEIHTRTLTEFGEKALVFEGGHFEVLYADPDEWIELRQRLELSEDLWQAAKMSHSGEAERIIEAIDRLESPKEVATNEAFVMPTPLVGQLITAGLSQRQATIQTLRMRGDSHDRIGQKLGIATGTVKSHCDRIDTKIKQAKQLLELVESESSY